MAVAILDEAAMSDGPDLSIEEFEEVASKLCSMYDYDTVAVYGGVENSLPANRYDVSLGSGGDACGWQNIPVWASSMEEIERAFDRACGSFDFLIPRDDKHYLPDFLDFLESITDVDEEKIARAIKAIKYEDFLHTDYWRMIAAQIRKMQRGLCALCPNECVDVHHPDYAIHGYEHSEGMRRLVALCRQCHENCWYKG